MDFTFVKKVSNNNRVPQNKLNGSSKHPKD